MRFSWLAAVGCIFLSGCFGKLGGKANVIGAGPDRSETRSVKEFRHVQLDGTAHVTITVGTPQSVKVTAQDNIVPVISTEVSGEILVIKNLKSYSSDRSAKVEIVTKSLEGIDCGGAGEMTAVGIDAKNFEATMDGTGHIKAEGTCTDAIVDVSGAGKLDLSGLKAKSAKVDLSGAGQAEVYATDAIEANLTGVGQIIYHGNPAKISKKVSGVGSISAR